MKALIKVGYGCNENCTFCHTAEIRHLEDTPERVERKIDRAKALGYSMVVLSGGEPTIRPELLSWARRVAALDLDFGLVTNGLLLSYPHVTDELVDRCRLRYVYMSLHGGDAKVQRSVVRADTFAQAIAALSRLVGRVPDLTVNCVVTTANLPHLRGVVDRLSDLSGLTLKFSMAQPKGAADRAFDVVVPDVAKCAAAVRDAIEYGVSRRATEGLRFAHDGIPFCLLPGLEQLYDDLKTHDYATMIEADEDDFVPVDDVAKVHPPVCAPCSLKGACPGLYRGYAELRGTDALTAKRGAPRANSYNFVPERDVARAPGSPCPIQHDGTSPYDRARTLFVRLPDRMRLFRTSTRDFSDEELLAIKEGTGQIYVDVSRKLAPDDFARDLRQLAPSRECVACVERPRCTGAWEPVREDRFTRDDARVHEIVAALTGRVLDVGCGSGRYLPALEGALSRGDVEYVALDPDQGALDLLAARQPEAKLVRARAEDVGAELGEFDHVLYLQSYNHLEDPRGAVARGVARLKPGGTLTVVDNTAFGMVRTQAHARRAEAAPENRLEHLQNQGAEEAAATLSDLGLELVERRDVSPATANQWLLRYVRSARMGA